MLKRVDHIEMAVNDVEAQVSFFKSLGFKETLRSGEAPRVSVQMKLPGENQVMFKFFLTKEGKGPGIDHISFELVEGESTREELKAKGITFLDEGKYVAKYGHEVSNLKDPNGNKWQFTEFVEKH